MSTSTKSAKTVCPVSRQQFAADAKPVAITLDGTAIQPAEAREFSTHSLGWYTSTKTTIMVGGKRVAVQVGVTVTVIGSKELPQE